MTNQEANQSGLFDMDEFIRGYKMEALVRAEDGETGGPLAYTSGVYELDDFCLDAEEEVEDDCLRFVTAAAQWLEEYPFSSYDAGCDFWLTRSGRKTGFRDREIPAEMSQTLTDLTTKGFKPLKVVVKTSGELDFVEA